MRLVEGVAMVGAVDDFVAELTAIGDAHGCVVQAFDAALVADDAHLETAVRYAARAHRRDDAIAREPAVEMLLYAAGRRQIDRAFSMGVEEGESPVVVAVVSNFPDEPLEIDDAEAEAAAAVAALLADATSPPSFASRDPDAIGEYFDVGAQEREATAASLAELVRERVVLLSIDH